MKHIDIREPVEEGDVKLEFLVFEDMLADLMAKTLTTRIHKMCSLLTLVTYVF